jgi:hypothetical protein
MTSCTTDNDRQAAKETGKFPTNWLLSLTARKVQAVCAVSRYLAADDMVLFWMGKAKTTATHQRCVLAYYWMAS